MMTRSILSNWIALAVTAAISFALTPVLIHGLGDFHYGMWVLVLSVVDYYGLLDLGIRTTLHRFVGRFKGMDERAALNETIATALAISSGMGFLVAGLTLVSTYLLSLFFGVQGPDRIVFRWLVLLLGLSVAVLFPARVLGAYLSGLQRFDLYNLTGITTVVVRAVLVVAALRFGYGVLGVSAATLGLSVLSLFLNWRLVRWADPQMSLAWRHTSWARMRELGSYSFYAFLNTLGDYLRFYTDSAVIARLLAIALVTPFSIAARLMDHFKQVVFAFVGPLMPRMSELDAQLKPVELRQLFLQSTRVSALISFFIGSLLLLDGQTLLYLWLGDRFLSSYPILLTLTAGYVATLAQFPSNIIVYAKARHQPLGWWILSEGAANLLLSIYFGTKYGLIGVALGTAVPMLVTGLLVQPWYALRLVPVSAAEYFREALARPLLTCVLFLGLCFLAADGKIQTSAAGFVLRLVWQGGFFVLLAYTIGLAGDERKIISQRSKDFTQLALRMARI